MTTSASFRFLRTGTIGSIVLGLAAGGHLAGGGQLPQPAILAALCALTVLPVAILTRFRLSLPVLAGVLGAGQAWLHWALGALSEGTTATAPLVSGHAGHTPVALVPEAFSSGMPAHTSTTDWQMFAAHAAATLCTAWVLARGEQALWALAAWLRPLVRLPEAVAVHPVRVPEPYWAPPALVPDPSGRRLPSRRGPPIWVPAA